MKFQIGWANDQMERMLLSLVEEWDELERWAIRNNVRKDQLEFASKEKEKMLAKIEELHAAAKAV